MDSQLGKEGCVNEGREGQHAVLQEFIALLAAAGSCVHWWIACTGTLQATLVLRHAVTATSHSMQRLQPRRWVRHVQTSC